MLDNLFLCTRGLHLPISFWLWLECEMYPEGSCVGTGWWLVTLLGKVIRGSESLMANCGVWMPSLAFLLSASTLQSQCDQLPHILAAMPSPSQWLYSFKLQIKICTSSLKSLLISSKKSNTVPKLLFSFQSKRLICHRTYNNACS